MTRTCLLMLLVPNCHRLPVIVQRVSKYGAETRRRNDRKATAETRRDAYQICSWDMLFSRPFWSMFRGPPGGKSSRDVCERKRAAAIYFGSPCSATLLDAPARLPHRPPFSALHIHTHSADILHIIGLSVMSDSHDSPQTAGHAPHTEHSHPSPTPPSNHTSPPLSSQPPHEQHNPPLHHPPQHAHIGDDEAAALAMEADMDASVMIDPCTLGR